MADKDTINDVVKKSQELEMIARNSVASTLNEMRKVCGNDAGLIIGSHAGLINLLVQTLGGLTKEIEVTEKHRQVEFNNLVLTSLLGIEE